MALQSWERTRASRRVEEGGDAYSSSLITATNTSGCFLTVTNDYNYESGTRFVNGFECKLKVSYDTSDA